MDEKLDALQKQERTLKELNSLAQKFVALYEAGQKLPARFRVPSALQTNTPPAISKVRDEKDEPDLHAHTVLGLPDGSTRGGHLLEGHVRPTLEVTITETPGHLVRRKKPDLGIALIDLG